MRRRRFIAALGAALAAPPAAPQEGEQVVWWSPFLLVPLNE